MKLFLSDFINEDQTGFLPRRQLRDNVRLILSTIEYYDKNPGLEVSWFFIDTEKAFDNVNWNFLRLVLDKLELGKNFKNAMLEIYQEQYTGIRINSDTTKSFRVEKGTRQGCPLSPLLFY